jgi:hypothetical protein
LRDDLHIDHIGSCSTSRVIVTLQDPQGHKIRKPPSTPAGCSRGETTRWRRVPASPIRCPATLELSTYPCPEHFAVLVLSVQSFRPATVWAHVADPGQL